METTFGSRRAQSLAKVSVFLITVALIAGIAGCAPTQYDLTISSTEGGEVTTPGEDTFTYNEGTVVALVAEADEGYRFVDWTGYVSAIADVNAAATNITMNEPYSITANFAPEILENLEIRTWYDLDDVRNNLAGNHTLMNVLDSTTAGYEELASPTANDGQGWQPIGTLDNPFNGTFDGQGHEIRDLFINRPDEDFVGLFSVVYTGGVVKDIGMVNVTATGNSFVGGLVGCSANGTVSNSYSTGSMTGDVSVGGLVGLSYKSTISNSHYNYAEVLINGHNIITTGALFGEDFDQWLVNDKFLDVNERLSKEDGYYVVNNVTEFKELLAFGQNSSLEFRLTNDLDLGNEPNFYIPYFAGDFDGNGHTISNWSFNSSFFYNVGLFGWLARGGRVTRVGVENVEITGASFFVGGLVGANWEGTVSNSYSTGSISGYAYVGGLVGANWEGTVSNSYSTCRVSGDDDVGGLVGYNNEEGTVSDSYSTGSVSGDDDIGGLVGTNWKGTVSDSYSTGSVSGDEDVGGLVGWNEGTVSNSYSTGSLIGDVNVGGLVGLNWNTVSNSYSTGNVSGRLSVGGLVGWNDMQSIMRNSYATGSVTGNTFVGGLVGRNNGTVTSNSYSTGSITGEVNVGGMVGENTGTVSNSYSTGSVTGNTHVGGLVGLNNGAVSNSYSTGSLIGDVNVGGLVGFCGGMETVSNSYSTGSVTGNTHVGGLVGYNQFECTISNSFWDTQTSGQATSDGGTGKTTAEMQDITTFSGATWDITAVNPSQTNPAYIWNIVDDVTYPFLSWEP